MSPFLKQFAGDLTSDLADPLKKHLPCTLNFSIPQPVHDKDDEDDAQETNPFNDDSPDAAQCRKEAQHLRLVQH